jgi:MSHA biogenesis protein MshG
VPRFEYSGRDRGGARVTGAIEANTLDAAVGQLFEQGITPLDVNERAEREGGTDLKRQLGLGQPKREELILFTRQMYALARSGVPLIRGLTQLAESTDNAVLAETIRQVMTDLESGRELAGALARHPHIFRPLYVAIVSVGEQSGRLEEAFGRIYQYLENEQETIQQIKSATLYPRIVLGVMVIAVFVLMTFVVPVFTDLFERFEDAELPLMTRILIGVSNFFVNYWWLLIALAIGGYYGFKSWTKTEQGAVTWDRYKLRVPIIGRILLRGALARFARAFSMAYRSGVPILEALNVVVAAVDNAWIARKVTHMREGIERGEALSRVAQRADVFTPLVVQMLAVGEETGRVEDMVEEVADFYEREVAYDVRHLGSYIEPILIMFMAVLVFILFLGIALPYWEIAMQGAGG